MSGQSNVCLVVRFFDCLLLLAPEVGQGFHDVEQRPVGPAEAQLDGVLAATAHPRTVPAVVLQRRGFLHWSAKIANIKRRLFSSLLFSYLLEHVAGPPEDLKWAEDSCSGECLCCRYGARIPAPATTPGNQIIATASSTDFWMYCQALNVLYFFSIYSKFIWCQWSNECNRIHGPLG